MQAEDVKIGQKVVPHDKTVKGALNFEDWLKTKQRGVINFKTKGYCIVEKSYLDNGFTLEGNYFNASDFEPYIEPTKDNAILGTLIQGNKTTVYLYQDEMHTGVSVCSPSDTFDPVKGVALAYARALGHDVQDIEIVVNPQPKTQGKPQVKFMPHLESGKYLYGTIGDKTPFKDAVGRYLFVGDTVELFKNGEYRSENIVVQDLYDHSYCFKKYFVMGIEAACKKDGTISGWQIIKKRSCSDIPNGEVIGCVKYVKCGND